MGGHASCDGRRRLKYTPYGSLNGDPYGVKGGDH